jgi:hypothetical protein
MGASRGGLHAPPWKRGERGRASCPQEGEGAKEIFRGEARKNLDSERSLRYMFGS